ncbi:hypothetical protein BA953_24750 (plasmid) [Vibrio coralliilyticus]|uniref:peptidase inhibitor family I36 protein n=1 Tax=Vibrio coralliilyticus TaxID=190893 RepID=UPI0008107BA4|nr:peptidase inhibitor family I36 protein [Vibrio coralliilyticus]ANW27407.1 hypothetical protein BA953_24750 [Vibrio coralliilyticus]
MLKKMVIVLLSTLSVSAYSEDKVCFYEAPDYQGLETCITQSTPNLSNGGSHSSIKVFGNIQATVWTSTKYRGERTEIMANASSLRTLNNDIRSAEIEPLDTDAHACFYEDVNFQGTPYCVVGDDYVYDMNTKNHALNDAFMSVYLTGGAVATVYEDQHFTGKSAIYKNSEADLSRQEMGNTISSMNITSEIWAQDEIIVRSETTTRAVPDSLTYKFLYDDNEILAVNMLLQTGDASSQFNVLVASHFFDYREIDGRKRLVAMFLYEQGRQELPNGDKGEDYTFKKTVLEQYSKSSPKWVIAVDTWDEVGRPSVLYKYRMGREILEQMYQNVTVGNEPLDNVSMDKEDIGNPIGMYKITYEDEINTGIKNVETFELQYSECEGPSCDAPVPNPIPGYFYTPSLDYTTTYLNGLQGYDFRTTFDYHMIDMEGDKVVSFYQQEVEKQNLHPSGRPHIIKEWANNLYNLEDNPDRILLWEYTMNDITLPRQPIDDFLFGFAMMPIASQYEVALDISHGSIIGSTGSGGDQSEDANEAMNQIIDLLDDFSPNLGTVVSIVGGM